MNPFAIKRAIQEMEGLPSVPDILQMVLKPATPTLRPDALLRHLSLYPELYARFQANCFPKHTDISTENMSKALQELGLEGIRKIVLQWAAPALIPHKEENLIDHSKFWQQAFAQATVAEALSQSLSEQDRPWAYAVGLLHDLGRMALAHVAPDDYGRVLALIEKEDLSLLEAERRELGVDHTLAGKWLAEQWNFPWEITAVIWLHHHPEDSLNSDHFPMQLIHLAVIAGALAKTCDPQSVLSQYDARCKALDLSLPVLEEACQVLEASPVEAPLLASEVSLPAVNINLPALNMEQRVRELELLHALQTRLTPMRSERAILSATAEALREGFHLPTGCCFTLDQGREHLEGVLWNEEAAIPERIALDLTDESNESSSSGLLALMRGLTTPDSGKEAPHQLLEHYGLMTVPITAQGETLGQLIFGMPDQESVCNQETLSAIWGFVEAAGNALWRCREREILSARTEDLAASLLDQDKRYQRLAREERLEGIAELAAGAAHQINNPLAIISGRAQILLSRAHNEEEQRALETIVGQSRRAGKVISDLMQFARPPEPHLEALRIESLLHQVAAMMQQRLRQKNIQLQEFFEEGLPQVRADRYQLEQVFVHLIVNAEQAMEKQGGTLTLTTKAVSNNHSVQIQVRDTGPGIPEDMQTRLYEPFYTSYDDANHTGLGLSLCKSMIEKHQGTVAVQSVSGEGVTVTVNLPAALTETVIPKQSAALEPTPIQKSAEEATASRKPLRVLLAEGNEDLCAVLNETLRAENMYVHKASDSLEALMEVMAQPLDMIVLDMDLPDIQGLPLIDRIHERARQTPIIGLLDPQNIPEFLSPHLSNTLQKPFALHRLTEMIVATLKAQDVA